MREVIVPKPNLPNGTDGKERKRRQRKGRRKQGRRDASLLKHAGDFNCFLRF